jgi:hypothetical protein
MISTSARSAHVTTFISICCYRVINPCNSHHQVSTHEQSTQPAAVARPFVPLRRPYGQNLQELSYRDGTMAAGRQRRQLRRLARDANASPFPIQDNTRVMLRRRRLARDATIAYSRMHGNRDGTMTAPLTTVCPPAIDELTTAQRRQGRPDDSGGDATHGPEIPLAAGGIIHARPL